MQQHSQNTISKLSWLSFLEENIKSLTVIKKNQ
jgi:hypothetical protein